MVDQDGNQDIEENENSSQLTNDSQMKDIELEILSPLDKKDDPRVKKYLRHLKSAIDNKEIKNLALSGVYGSGKSTIIKSFKSEYPNLEILNISLASFNETSDYATFKDQIQLNILQQIIYSQKAEKLPESRISRISELNVFDPKNWIKVSAFLSLIVSTYLLLSFYTYQLNPNNWKLTDDFNFSCFVLVILSIVSMTVIGQIFIELLKNLKINKISLKDAEFGNKAESKDLLNKHIDEILYFFEKISIDIVVIEDLDRFNTTEIYRTLREINFILNSYLYNIKPNDPRKVTFLYAIKDDLFLNELDRTKFFDLIIPAIPFVNYSNSKNVLNEKLDKIFIGENVFNKPTKEFINTVSSFISDNRTLINIINEFIIYKEQQKLEKEELNPEKLLALIIYKNLRPKDFSKLHISKSNIDLMFLNKGKLIEKSISDLDKKIDLILEKIEKINKINVQNIKDLNTIYVYNIKEILQDENAKGLMYNSERTTFRVIIDKPIDLNEFYDKEITYFTNSGSGYPTGKRLNNIDDKIKDYTYAEKFDLISNKNQRKIEKEDEIKKCRDEQVDLFNWSLKQIFEDKNLSKEDLKKEFDVFYVDSAIQENDKIYNDPLLMFLLLNGYVDEHYKEYISIFQKGGLNETDQEFKINIISRISEPKPYNYELTNVDDIIDELPINYFKNDRILNIDIVNHLTAYKSNYPEKFKALLNTIANWNSRRTKHFLSSYIYDGNQKELFISELAKSWNKFWHTIEKDSHLIEDDKKQILNMLLNFVDVETLLYLNRDKELSSYVANDVSLLFDFKEISSIDRIKKILSVEVLDIQFKELLSFNDKSDALFNVIYKNWRYEMTYDNLGTIIEYKLDIDFVKFETSNLTYIYENNLEEIVKYIESDHYNSYIKNVYSQLEYGQNENSVFVLNVLNNENVDEDLKLIFIQKQENKLLNFSGIKKVIDCDLLVKEDKIEISWSNVYEYYWEYDNSFNEILNTFLNEKDHYLVLGLTVIKINKEKDLQNEFILKLISNNSLVIEAYSVFVEKSIPKIYKFPNEFNYKLISREKVEKLIQFNVIPLTVYSFKEIKSIYPGAHIKLLLRNWTNYLDFYNKHKTEIEVEDIILLLQDPILREGLKHHIIKNQISDDDLLNKELAIEVSNLLINTKIKIKDINSLLNFNRLLNIFTNVLEDDVEVRLINLIGNKLTKAEILTLKDLMPEPFINIHPKSQLLLPDNKINWEFIKILKSKGIAGEAKINSKKEVRVWLNNYNK